VKSIQDLVYGNNKWKMERLLFLFLVVIFLTGCTQNRKVKIIFHTNTPEVIEPIEASPGEMIVAPTNPSREGYRFDGWMLHDQIYSFQVMPNETIELIAKWTPYYNIYFNSVGGTAVSSIKVAQGDSIVLPEEPKLERSRFLGWIHQDIQFVLTKMPGNDLNLVASWAPLARIYFDAQVHDRHLNETIHLDIAYIEEIIGSMILSTPKPEYPEYHFVSWQLNGLDYEFDLMHGEDITLTAKWIQLSNLPALFIDLFDETDNPIPIEAINREEYVTSIISLVNTSAEYRLNNLAALFRGRGNGSWIDAGDKKGYRIKFDKQQSLFGATKSKHWVILANANFDDVTMYRNKLAYNMASEIFTNIEYVTIAEWVDVYINQVYHGTYLLCEQVRVEDDRVDIESEYGILDTGYLVEYDAYAKGVNGVDYFRVTGLKYPFTMKSPSPDDFLAEGYTIDEYKAQVQYIQGLVSEMVSAILSKDFNRFIEYADANSFVDMYLLHELFKNIDTGYSSFYLYRAAGGKLFAGPPWDFDATCGSSPNRGNGSPNGIYVALSVQAFSSRTANEMLINLYATPEFKALIKTRWNQIVPAIEMFIQRTLTQEMIETNQYAMGRNFVKWPTPFGFGPVLSQEVSEANWGANILVLRKWMLDRVIWLTNEWNKE
jgi:uncharacterized repeat protein (TIGR02543 family)